MPPNPKSLAKLLAKRVHDTARLSEITHSVEPRVIAQAAGVSIDDPLVAVLKDCWEQCTLFAQLATGTVAIRRLCESIAPACAEATDLLNAPKATSLDLAHGVSAYLLCLYTQALRRFALLTGSNLAKFFAAMRADPIIGAGLLAQEDVDRPGDFFDPEALLARIKADRPDWTPPMLEAFTAMLLQDYQLELERRWNS